MKYHIESTMTIITSHFWRKKLLNQNITETKTKSNPSPQTPPKSSRDEPYPVLTLFENSLVGSFWFRLRKSNKRNKEF